MRSFRNAGRLIGVLLVGLAFALSGEARAGAVAGSGRWISGDFHSYTLLNDGNYTTAEVVRQGFERYGLDWMANEDGDRQIESCYTTG